MPDCVWFFASLGFSVVRASVSMRIFTRSDLLAFLGPTVSRERPLVALLIDLARQTLPA